MAGMSNSEYARHKAKEENKGKWLSKVIGLALAIVIVPSVVIPLVGIMFVVGLLWAMIGEGLFKEDRY